VVGVMGLIDELTDVPPPAKLQAGDDIVVVGDVRPELGGSEWAAVVHGLDGGMPPAADLDRAKATHDVVAGLVRERAVHGIHDVSDGGLAVALAEMAIAGEVGARVEVNFDGCTPAESWFAESASVFVLAVDPERTAEVLGRIAATGVPAQVIGVAGGSELTAAGTFSVPLAAAAQAWRDALPRLMQA
jgi:phosphoribosylformylglycinamidine synthase